MALSTAHINDTMKTAARHHRAGRLGQAEQLYRLILQNQPDSASTWHLLGIIAHQKGDHDAAVELIEKAIELNRESPNFHNTLGLVFEALGKFDQAIEAYQRALDLAPDYAEAFHNMAIALQSQGRYDATVEKCKKAVSIRPDYAEAYNTAGYALQMQGKHNEAIDNYIQAVQCKSDFAEAYNHLGVVLSLLGRHNEAIENYRKAIRIEPDYAEVHWNSSLSLLLTGRLAQGWKEYKWRQNPSLEMTTYPHNYETSCWDGTSFENKRLLVHYEQGLGDTIQFVRYLPMVKARGGTVILGVREPLYGLLSGFAGVDEVVEASFDNKPAVDFDLHVPLMDLPGIFGTTLETIPANVPYIRPNPAKVDYWRVRLSGPDFKVGIVWSGSSLYERNHLRACKLADFGPLSAIDGVKLYALQKGKAAEQMERLADRIPVVDLGKQLEDFSDTAAAIENLDLIISTDTCVPHLAGAMGRPVWLLLCGAPEWRWLLNRLDSPWYPTMRLFRQSELGRWDDVFREVARRLRILVAKEKKYPFRPRYDIVAIDAKTYRRVRRPELPKL